MNIMHGLFIAIMILLVSACQQESRDNGNMPNIDYQRIVADFSYQQPEPLTTEKNLPPAENYLKLRLAYPDPLSIKPTTLVVDGSNAIAPITQVMIDEFYDEGYTGNFRMNQSSTGAGLEAMCQKTGIDIVNATRKIKSEEKSICEKNGIIPITIQIGLDPFVIITHPENTWMTTVSKQLLPSIFTSGRWVTIDSTFPKEKINFYMPNKYSDSMDAMTEFVYGDKDEPFIRFARNASFYPYNLELTQDLSENKHGIGFASFGQLQKLKQLNLNIIPVDGRHPIRSGSDYPIKRPLYLITNTTALRKPEVQSFIAHYLNRAYEIMPKQGFSPLNGMQGRYARYNYIEAVNSVQAGDNVPVFVAK